MKSDNEIFEMGVIPLQEDRVYCFLSSRIRHLLERANPDLEKLQEIRLRAGKPLLLRYGGKEYFLTKQGQLSDSMQEECRVSAAELKETLEYVSGYSLYAFDEELKQGYITVPGGHRIGVAGKIVMEKGRITCIRHITCINIRLSHQVIGCADPVLPYVTREQDICHTLIISPPGCGKTTLLRDIIRQASNGCEFLAGKTVGVVDERSEIAGSYMGVPQNDVGMRTDVLDGCTKTEGMMMLLRSMSPQIIAVDEIGSYSDQEALENVFHCGCRLLATVHGNSVEDIRRRPLLQHMLQNRMFERYVVLCAPGIVKEIFDERGTLLFRGAAGEAAG